MQMVLNFIKRFARELICAGIALLALALLFLGMNNMSSVQEDMEKIARLNQDLRQFQGKPDPANPKSLDLARDRIEMIQSAYKETVEFAARLNKYVPLIEGVFVSSNPSERLEFRQAYQKELSSWLSIIEAKGPPTDVDVRNAMQVLENKRRERQQPSGDAPDDSDDGRGKGDADREKSQQREAEVYAAVQRAREIKCYATNEAFQISDADRMFAGLPPLPEQMWRAQLEVWIQHDVLESIKRVNESAAGRLDGGNAWVGNMPVKELVSIRTSKYYITDEGVAAKPGQAQPEQGETPSTNPADSYTGLKGTQLYEVMRFTVVMVVDARDIPAIVAEISRDGFHNPYNMDYTAVEPNAASTGKLYGDEPVVRLRVDFETIFLSELYLPMMPDGILTELKKTRPVPETEGGGIASR